MGGTLGGFRAVSRSHTRKKLLQSTVPPRLAKAGRYGGGLFLSTSDVKKIISSKLNDKDLAWRMGLTVAEVQDARGHKVD